jgi:hypothetical protein
MLRGISQTQKVKCHMLSHMQNLFIFQRHESLGDNQGRGGDQWEGGEETKECKG